MTSKLERLEPLRPPDSAAALPANRPQMKVEFLAKVLQTYFGRSLVARKGNQIYVRTPSSTACQAKYAHFTGSVDVTFEDERLPDGMREFKQTTYPRLTFQDEKKKHIETLPVRDFDDLKQALTTYWPEEEPQPPTPPPHYERPPMIEIETTMTITTSEGEVLTCGF